MIIFFNVFINHLPKKKEEITIIFCLASISSRCIKLRKCPSVAHSPSEKGLSYLYSDMVLILISGFYYRPLSKKETADEGHKNK